MGFPSIRSSTPTNYDGDGTVTAHSIELPATIESGDYIVVAFFMLYAGSSGITVTWPAGWTELFDPGGAYEQSVAVAWKVATGSEDGTTINLTTSGSTNGLWASWAISGVTDTPVGTVSQTTGASYDPPSVTPPYGLADYLVLTGCGTAQSSISITGAPSGYSNFAVYGASTADAATATNTVTSSSENPGVFSHTGTITDFVAFTVMIPGTKYSGSSMFMGSNF